MIVGLGKKNVEDYVSPLESGEPKTTFKVSVLPARMKETFAETVGKDNKMKVSVVDVALAGIKEICCGEVVITEITEDVLDAIPFEVLADVSRAIIERSFVSGQEQKN